jgi:BA14K-like protein
MMSTKYLSGLAALALIVAAPSASFAAWRGGGGPAMGARMAAPSFSGSPHFTGAPSASFAAVGPRAAAAPGPVGTTTWNGGRTAWSGGWRGDRDFHHRRFFPGAFAAGAALGAYAAYAGSNYYDYGPGYYDDTYYDNGYYDDGGTVAVVPVQPGGDASWCAQTYRSYDPASGTYLGFDGLRHPCP